MWLVSFLVCFSAFLHASLSTPLVASKPKPVDLAFTCTTVIDASNPDFKHDDVPVILLHGMTLNKETWHGIIEILALATKKKICAVDLRNHGQSPWNDEEYDVIAMTEDVKHFIEEIKAPKAVVLGHSLGGRIAVHLALNYPEKVEKIIVEDMRPNKRNPAVTDDQHYFRALKELAGLIPQGVEEREAQEAFRSLLKEYLEKFNFTYEEDDLSLIPVKCADGKCQLRINPAVLDAALRNLDELLNESSGRFDGPALFIYGTESPVKVGEDEKTIKELFPNAELVAVEGAGHFVHPFKKFLKEVIRFIQTK